jgi:hypothetical protein
MSGGSYRAIQEKLFVPALLKRKRARKGAGISLKRIADRAGRRLDVCDDADVRYSDQEPSQQMLCFPFFGSVQTIG